MDSDEALAGRLRAGDRSALADLEERFRARLHRVALLHCGNRDDAQDLVQESLIAACESIARYEPGTSFGAWLMGIAANRALAWRRREVLRRHETLQDSPAPAPLDSLDASERSGRVRRALASLPDRERLILILRAVEGWPSRKIAEHLGIAAPSVSTALWQARTKLAALLESEIQD